jgi:hypothetical protein
MTREEALDIEALSMNDQLKNALNNEVKDLSRVIVLEEDS